MKWTMAFVLFVAALAHGAEFFQEQSPDPVKIVGPAVTMAKYASIRNGMKYEQVVSILGRNGEEISRSKALWHTAIMYQWKNPNGSNMVVMFQNGKMTTKAQSSLP